MSPAGPLRLNREELAALRDVLDLPAGALRNLPGAELTPLEPPRMDDAIRRLLGRGVLTAGPGGELSVEATAAQALRLVPDAGLIIRLDSSLAGSGHTTVWFASPERAAQWHTRAIGSFAATVLPATELLLRVAARANLVGQDAVASPEIRVSLDLAGQVGVLLDAGDATGARVALAAELHPAAAAALVDVLRQWRASYQLTAYHLDDSGRFTAASVSWIDAAGAGLWLTGESNRDALACAPAAASRVMTEFLDGMPGRGP